MPLKKKKKMFSLKSHQILCPLKNWPNSVSGMIKTAALIYWCQIKYAWVEHYFVMEKVSVEALPISTAWAG